MPFSHPLVITPNYAALLAGLFVVLSVRVLLARRKMKVGFGSAGDDRLERRIRSHANFAEYVPFALILIALVEMKGLPGAVIHGLCMLLLIGRLVHSIGLARPQTDLLGRTVGMAGTLTAIVAAALMIVFG